MSDLSAENGNITLETDPVDNPSDEDQSSTSLVTNRLRMMLDAAGRSDLPATRESWLLLTDDEIVQTSEVYVNEVDEEEAAFMRSLFDSNSGKTDGVLDGIFSNPNTNPFLTTVRTLSTCTEITFDAGTITMIPYCIIELK